MLRLLLLLALIVAAAALLSSPAAAQVPLSFQNFDSTRETTKYALLVSPQEKQAHAQRLARSLAALATHTRKHAFARERSPASWSVVPYDTVTPSQLSCVATTARYNASIQRTGWDYLDVDFSPNESSSNSQPAELQFYNAGLLEGYLTCKTLLAARRATFKSLRASNGSDSSIQWAVSQLQFMAKEAQKPEHANDPYWQHVLSVLAQIQGLVDACNTVSRLHIFSFFEIWAINLDMEWNAISRAISRAASSSNPPLLRETVRQEFSHCSAALAMGRDGSLYASQVVWAPFNSVFNLYRVWKTYRLGSNAVVLRMSSYLGMVHSADSFYVVESARGNMVVQETTIGNYNSSLYAEMTTRSVAEFVRSMVATYLAASDLAATSRAAGSRAASDRPAGSRAQLWTQFYGRLNSGTYSNQWMIADLAAGRVDFWVAEQSVTKLFAFNATEMLLQQQGYFASYNIPMLEATRARSGFTAMQEKFGDDFFSYAKCPRALIFSELRDTARTSFEGGFAAVMRTNRFKSDKYSLIDPQSCRSCAGGVCSPKYSPMLAIASRGDLGAPPGNATCYGRLSPWIEQQMFGAADAKIVALPISGAGTPVRIAAVSGPTNLDADTPTFTLAPADTLGLIPSVYNFSFMRWL